MKHVIATLVGAAIITPLFAAPAHAGPIGEGCVSDFWMWRGLRSAERIVCDSDRRADGSWQRTRGFFDSEYYVPFQCGRYSCWGGYWVGELEVIDSYPVTDATVLSDEPGWIPSAEPRIVR